MKKTMRSQCLRVILIPGLLLLAAAPLQAANEVSGINLSPTVMADKYVRLTEPLTISWTAPDGSAGPVMGYYFKFNTSSTSLSGAELDDVTNDFSFGAGLGDMTTVPASTFASYDSNQLHYLHIRAQYISTATSNIAYSDDVVTGPIRIDNVAPTGTLTLNPTSGSSTDVTVESMSFTEPIEYYWLSSTDSFPGGTGTKYSPPLAQGGTVALPPTATPGNKYKIYGWFSDYAGNRTTAASAIAEYEYKAAVAIQYNASSINVGGSLAFTVDGSTSYTWTITDRSPTDVAAFSGGGTGPLAGASVTVVGAKAGTFKVTAKPGSGDDLVTGTITVKETNISKEFDLITTTTTSTNTIGFIFENTGLTTAHELGEAVGNCTQVAKWNAQTQSYLSHRMQFATLNNFTLNVGEAYFVTVTTPHKFTLTGTEPTSHTQTLITTTTTNTNAIGVPKSKGSITKAHDLGTSIGNCSQVAKWNASTQSYLSHRMQFPTLNNFDVAWGEGYFVTVTQETAWPW